MNRRTFRALIVAAVVATMTTLGMSPAFAAQPSQTPAPKSSVPFKHCVTVVEKLKPGQRASKIDSQTCSTNSQANLAAPATATLLMTVYEDAGFGGYSDDLYGNSGTCDSSGYGFSDFDGPNIAVGGVSSYVLYGNCTAGEYFTGYDFTGAFSGIQVTQQLFYVGDEFNDNINSMAIYQF